MQIDRSRYELGQTIGVGATGKVKLGVHRETGQRVAVKIVNATCESRCDDSTLSMQRVLYGCCSCDLAAFCTRALSLVCLSVRLPDCRSVCLSAASFRRLTGQWAMRCDAGSSSRSPSCCARYATNRH
jgi:hypothetical protein